MRPIRSISVLMPTFEGRQFLDRALRALSRQEVPLPWDVHVVDSGSTDGTFELLLDWKARFPVPMAVERIHKVEFDHGDTRNRLAARSRGDLLAYLTQDAIPTSPRWLATLAGNFADERVGAASCRNVPRSDAEILTRIFSARDPGYSTARRETRLSDPEAYAVLSPDERRELYQFNDVASAVRRELWERHPFPRTSFGEDVLMARALLEAGYTVVYDAEATVEHSHDYGVEETYARGFVDGRFNAEWLGRTCVGSPYDVGLIAERELARDALALAELGLDPLHEAQLLERARELREAGLRGLHDGGRTARRRPTTRVLSGAPLHVLYVVHGFPPDTWAGTEVYTYNLVKEMTRRGHRCTILARVPADERELPDFSVEDAEFQGLRVLRLTHRLQHASLRESYHQPRVDAVFDEVLARERPDAVHFQHLIHLSAGLVEVARRRGLPTVITCHDYWAICSRVQLIRPDGERCESNMGSGCYLCVRESKLRFVPRVHRMDTATGELARGFAREVRSSRLASSSLRLRAGQYDDMRSREEFVLDAYAAADLRISPSRFLREKLLATGRFDPHTFLFSDNGMRSDHVRALEKRRRTDGRVRFGFVGTLVWYKGGEVLVRAMNRLAGRAAELNVFGDFRPATDEHHAALERLATAGNVHFRGRFDNARLSEVFAEIDVLVVPSLWFENSPIAIHEAFLTHTPVLASGIGGMAEYVRDGVDGLHFAVGDDADLAAKMSRFLDEPGLVDELSRDWMPIKTIEADAADTEFRYRALLARASDAPLPAPEGAPA